MLFFQKLKIDYGIDLEKVNKKDIEVFWEFLYNIFWEELLVLKKKLIKFLNKDFIQVNKSVVVVLILFIWKLEEGFCFCINYRVLNKINKKN